jgi:hypothetical protein
MCPHTGDLLKQLFLKYGSDVAALARENPAASWSPQRLTTLGSRC